MSPQYRFRASVLAAVIAASGAVGAAGMGVVAQVVGKDGPAPVDCSLYLKQLQEVAAANPNVATVVTATTPNGKPVIHFDREAKQCGEPGPILEGLLKSTTTVPPTTTTSRP